MNNLHVQDRGISSSHLMVAIAASKPTEVGERPEDCLTPGGTALLGLFKTRRSRRRHPGLTRFALNRELTSEMRLEITAPGFDRSVVTEATTLQDTDLKVANSPDAQKSDQAEHSNWRIGRG